MSSPAKLKVFVVDDEAPARRKIIRFLGRDPDVELLGEAGDGASAVSAIRKTRPDLLFIDVQMPGMDGFEVVRALEPDPVPHIVFVTAHDEYAIRAFDVHAFGYLLKPFDHARFEKVLAAAKQRLTRDQEEEVKSSLQRLLAEVQRKQQPAARLLVQQKDRAFFLPLEKIDWAEAERNYLNLHAGDQTYTIRGTIESLEEKLDSAHFLRLNRSCVVRIDFIRELQNWFHGEYKVVLRSGETLTWTRRYVGRRPEILEKL
ncbi:MAG TPA: LytTR family DNA-binding domain-containing protein [Terriglobales bacterium]|nr:LytTR family DNA-binding domain-containing protein [Terriglobales bacterium]